MHESDLFGRAGGEGLAGTTIEHIDPRSISPEQANDYGNLLYACRFCNTARSNLPTEDAGRRLLNPTETAWGRHFRLQDDRLEPNTEDRDATYTAQAYDLNDPRKIRRRSLRRRLLEDRYQLIAELSDEIAHLQQLADTRLRAGDLDGFQSLVQESQNLGTQARRALEDLAHFPAVPRDAPKNCRCPSGQYCKLPDWLDKQTVEISRDS